MSSSGTERLLIGLAREHQLREYFGMFTDDHVSFPVGEKENVEASLTFTVENNAFFKNGRVCVSLDTPLQEEDGSLSEDTFTIASNYITKPLSLKFGLVAINQGEEEFFVPRGIRAKTLRQETMNKFMFMGGINAQTFLRNAVFSLGERQQPPLRKNYESVLKDLNYPNNKEAMDIQYERARVYFFTGEDPKP